MNTTADLPDNPLAKAGITYEQAVANIRRNLAAFRVGGYTPPAVDLAPFREGELWHYKGQPYVITSMSLDTSVRPTLSPGGEPMLYESSPVALRLRMEALSGFGELPADRALDAWTGGTGYVSVGGQVWQVMRADGIGFGGETPHMWEFNLYRAAWRDEQPSAVQGGAVTGEMIDQTLTELWQDGRRIG